MDDERGLYVGVQDAKTVEQWNTPLKSICENKLRVPLAGNHRSTFLEHPAARFKMNMLRELRQNYASFIADAESSIGLAEPPADAAKPAVYHVYPVSPPTVMRLGFEDWLPPAMRGLEVYFPAEDWRIPDDACRTSGQNLPDVRRRPVPECCEALCLVCGCGLYWEAINAPAQLHCVECQPVPSRRMAEDLWLVESERSLVCVSDNERWVRAAFFHLAEADRQQREEAATKAAKDNAGF